MATKKSQVWLYVSNANDAFVVQCKMGKCSDKLKVGKDRSTGCLWKHLAAKHPKEYSAAGTDDEKRKHVFTSWIFMHFSLK